MSELVSEYTPSLPAHCLLHAGLVRGHEEAVALKAVPLPLAVAVTLPPVLRVGVLVGVCGELSSHGVHVPHVLLQGQSLAEGGGPRARAQRGHWCI